MSSTGITRKIDELGRIVIPKEIRYNLGIRDGEPLEIFVNDDSILIKKYSQIKNINNISSYICELMSEVLNINILITDREKIIASNKNLLKLNNNLLDESKKILIDNRETYISNNKEKLFDIEGYLYMYPIITTFDCCGLIIIIANSKNEEYKKYAKIIQKLIEYQLDIA